MGTGQDISSSVHQFSSSAAGFGSAEILLRFFVLAGMRRYLAPFQGAITTLIYPRAEALGFVLRRLQRHGLAGDF